LDAVLSEAANAWIIAVGFPVGMGNYFSDALILLLPDL
jgi:hypothetical protein